MRPNLSVVRLLVLVAGGLFVPAAAHAAFTPDQVWRFAWETYVDLQPGNSNVSATDWDFTTNRWEEVYVDGDGVDNVGDGDEHQGDAAERHGDNFPLVPSELAMTISVPKPNTLYSVSAVVMSEAGNDANEWGITSGFTSGTANQVGYCCANMSAAHVNRLFNDEWLARVPLGTTSSNENGQITVYFNENPNLNWNGDSLGGSVVDGIIWAESADVVAPPARLITAADRKNGYSSSNSQPAGSCDGETDPLTSDDYGLRLGARGFSDRVFHVDDVSPELIGADYVRTFLGDKGDDGDFSYGVTLSQDVDNVFLMVLVDDRFANMQTTVDSIVSDFAGAGTFVDTGWNIDLSDASSSHPLSAFGKWVSTKDGLGNPITYTFGAVPKGSTSTYMIAAMVPEPSICVLAIGAAWFALLRRRPS